MAREMLVFWVYDGLYINIIRYSGAEVTVHVYSHVCSKRS